MDKAVERRFSLGVDYGTNSVRALVVDVANGEEIATAVYDYPSGAAGVLLDPQDPHLARQNPADYVAGFYGCVRRAVTLAKKQPGFRPDQVIGIGIDTTGSTPIPVERDGMPLALRPEFADNPAAHAWLWKDHTAHAEAAEITAKAAKHPDQYLTQCGGTYSSEWYWSKILHCKRTAPDVFRAAYAWVELADFIPALVTGQTDRARCAECLCGGAQGHVQPALARPALRAVPGIAGPGPGPGQAALRRACRAGRPDGGPSHRRSSQESGSSPWRSRGRGGI